MLETSAEFEDIINLTISKLQSAYNPRKKEDLLRMVLLNNMLNKLFIQLNAAIERLEVAENEIDLEIAVEPVLPEVPTVKKELASSTDFSIVINEDWLLPLTNAKRHSLTFMESLMSTDWQAMANYLQQLVSTWMPPQTGLTSRSTNGPET